MKIRKRQITRKLCNYIFKILCLLAFFFFLAFQTFIKIFVFVLFCFYLFLGF